MNDRIFFFKGGNIYIYIGQEENEAPLRHVIKLLGLTFDLMIWQLRFLSSSSYCITHLLNCKVSETI